MDDERDSALDEAQEGGDGFGQGSEEAQGAGAETGAGRQLDAVMRAARMAGRGEAEREMQQRYNESIKNLGIKNPYTGGNISSLEELDRYNDERRKQELEKRARAQGKEPGELREDEANREYLSKMRRADAEQEKQRARQRQREEFLRSDLQDFARKYPNVDPAALENNKRFRTFSKGRLYTEPLAEIYADFEAFSTETERAALAKKQDRDSRSVGAGASTAGAVLTSEQQKRLDEWNTRYPEQKMTAKEFYKRGQ